MPSLLEHTSLWRAGDLLVEDRGFLDMKELRGVPRTRCRSGQIDPEDPMPDPQPLFLFI